MQKVQLAKMKKLQWKLQIALKFLLSIHLLICQSVNPGDDRIVQAVQGLDANDILLDPCQLQNSSNTGQSRACLLFISGPISDLSRLLDYCL